MITNICVSSPFLGRVTKLHFPTFFDVRWGYVTEFWPEKYTLLCTTLPDMSYKKSSTAKPLFLYPFHGYLGEQMLNMAGLQHGGSFGP